MAAAGGTEAAVSGEEREVRETRAADGKCKPYEHEVLSRVFDSAVACYVLILNNMAWVEYAFRRLQLIEEADTQDPNNPTYEALSRRAHGAAELEREATILEERPEVREVRAAERKRRPDKGKGMGRGAASGATESQ